MKTFDVSSLPTINLGGPVVYDAFVIRGLRGNGVRLPQEREGLIAFDTVGQALAAGNTDEFAMVDAIGKALWPLFVKHPPAPSVRDSAYVAAVWRYLIVPSALVSSAVCLDYWTGRNLRNIGWIKTGGRVAGYGSHHPTVHAEEHVRAKQVLFEALGDTEGAKYANNFASRANPRMWVKQLRKRQGIAAAKVTELGFSYGGFLRWPFTVTDDDERLTVWVLDNHFRHPSGPYLPNRREPDHFDYGGACATTYSLLLSLLYDDATGRFAGLLPALDSKSVSRA